MGALIHSEWERILSRKKTLLIIGGYLLYLLVMAGVYAANQGGIGKYDEMGHTVALNKLNFLPFFLSDFYMITVLVILPVLAFDSFSGEHRGGSYRLVLLRPHSFKKLFVAKWLTLNGVIMFGLLFTFGIGWMVSQWFLPDAESVTFYFLDKTDYHQWEAFGFSLKYLFFEWLILSSLLAICALFSLWISNTLAVYVIYILFLLGSIYIYDPFTILIVGHRLLFEILTVGPGVSGPGTWLFLLGALPVTLLLSLFLWNRRDWLR